MKNSLLVGCIQALNKTIKTRFFYVNPDNNELRDVTYELCNSIKDFNAIAQASRDNGTYSMLIPYTYKNGMAEYSFGCGLAHYLQEDVFEELAKRSVKELSFPLTDCRISMYTPSDVKSILSASGVFDVRIEDSLRGRFGMKKIA